MAHDYLWVPVVVISLMFTWQLRQLAVIMETMQENRMALADELKAIKDQLVKAKSEITSKIGDLEIAVASLSEQSPEVTEAIADLKSVAQSLDDVVADVPVESEDGGAEA